MKKILLIAILSVFCSGCFSLNLGIKDLRDNPCPEEAPVNGSTTGPVPVPE